MPALRHDWSWPLQRGEFWGWFQIATSGWTPFGMGAPTEHIERYLLAVPVTAVGFALGGRLTLFLYLLTVGYAVCATGAALAKRFAPADGLVAAAAGAFLLFNPWTYTEVVAGHVEMILASAGIAGMLSRLAGRPREGDGTALSLYVVVAYSQVQFFLFALVLAIGAALLRRGRLPLWTALAVGGPTFVGLAGNFGALATTPSTIPWQLDQSLEPASAWRLLGYFTSYAAGFEPVSWVIGAVCLCAAFGLYFARRTPAGIGFACAAPVVLFAMCGLRGPFAVPYAWLLVHFAPIGVFRELYDLGGLLLLCYAALAAAGAAGTRWLRGVLPLAAGVLVATWLVTGVTRWWVPAQTIPALDVAVAAGQRYALLPPFQPLRFNGLGEGSDPDMLYRLGGVVALNEYQPHYPGDAALATYAATGDPNDLAALGVAAVYDRPWLTEGTGPFGTAQPLVNGRTARQAALETRGVERAIPLVSVMAPPALERERIRLGAGDVFFGDAAGLSGPGVPADWQSLPHVRPILPGREEVDAARAWVDARLSFIADPVLAQPFGGVVTRSTVPFSLRPGGDRVLAFVRGRLFDQRGAVVSTGTGGYRWLALPADTSSLRCAGTCALTLLGNPPALAPAGAERAPAEALGVWVPMPWLVTARGLRPAAGPRMLRLNVAFDPHWVAFAGPRLLPHVRLDGTVNGWLDVPPGGGGVLFCNALALLQTLCELAGALWVVFLLRRAVLYWSP